MDKRYSAQQHWFHKDWTVYDADRQVYRLRGLMRDEAVAYAMEYNRQAQSREPK